MILTGVNVLIYAHREDAADYLRALEFCTFLRDQPNAVSIHPGERHWEIFTNLCSRARAGGNLVADAYLAAMAIESGCEWIPTDRDYSRFPSLRWRHPF